MTVARGAEPCWSRCRRRSANLSRYFPSGLVPLLASGRRSIEAGAAPAAPSSSRHPRVYRTVESSTREPSPSSWPRFAAGRRARSRRMAHRRQIRRRRCDGRIRRAITTPADAANALAAAGRCRPRSRRGTKSASVRGAGWLPSDRHPLWQVFAASSKAESGWNSPSSATRSTRSSDRELTKTTTGRFSSRRSCSRRRRRLAQAQTANASGSDGPSRRSLQLFARRVQ